MSSPSRNADKPLPAVDEHLLAGETRYELDDGKLVYVPPANEPHGTLHSKLSALLEAHVAAELDVASDMLTRTGETTEIAPDVSVFPHARDLVTGGRQLEQLAFEIASTQSLGDAGRKAKQLSERGVRRVFAIDVERKRAFEWSRELGTWSILDTSSSIEDPSLAVALPVAALVRAAKTDDVIAKALLAKHNPILEAALLETREEGKAEGKAEAVIAILAARELHPQPDERHQILAERDPNQLDRLLGRALTCASVAELLATR